MQIKKRDGRIVAFNQQKIKDAVLSAFKEVDGEISEYAHQKADNIAQYVEECAKDSNNILTVEEIQDLVENGLMSTKRKDVARAYVIYRNERTRKRNYRSDMIKNVSAKLLGQNDEKSNANMDEMSFGGRMGEANEALTKQYALDYCVSKMARDNHLNNEIYIHDLGSYVVGMHNCAARETKFLTNQGVASFYDFQDGELITVLTHTGEMKDAQVKKYGIQKLNKITFSRAGQRFTTERFTADHRWILHDGSITTHLKIGDKIYKAPVNIRNFNFENASEKEQYYWCLGFVLADGTEAYRWSHGKKQEDITFVRLRLCGEKIKFADRFKILKHSIKEMDNGDLYLTFSSTINFHKNFPELTNLTWNEKLALFDGLYCADGQHSGSRKSILTSNEQIASFIEDVAPSLGYFITNVKDKTGEKTNDGIRKFTKEYSFIEDSNKYYWTVVDIEEDAEEEVWCLNVRDNHSFVLPNGIVTGNCLSVPFDKLLSKGFNTRQADIRPANSISTAFQLVAVIFQLQSLQQFGGVSATHLDWTMVPYIRKSFYKHYKDGLKYIDEGNNPLYQEWIDKITCDTPIDKYTDTLPKTYQYAMDMTLKELNQAVEAMYHNLNTLQSRSGNQLPFTSINYGTCTLPEGRMVIKSLLEGSLKGVGSLHKTSIFPCGIFQYMKGVNDKPGTPNYDLYKLALKSTSQRLYPNYANVDWSGNAGYDRNDPKTYFSTMGCRTANGADINAEQGVNPQTKDGRGNICPVTIIMPTLAMEAKEKITGYAKLSNSKESGYNLIEEFMDLLNKKINEAKEMLLERYEWICSQSPQSAKFMYENRTMLGYNPDEGIRSAMKHGTLAIGQLGLAETLQILIGTDHTTEEGMRLAKKIEQLFKDKCAEFKVKEHLNFGVYYTPAENLCYTAMKKFKQKYGEIENVSDHEFFTNSMHVPVWKEMSPFEKIDIESQLTGYSSAGCITYIELDGGVKNNIDALETIVNYAMNKDIPYFAINVPNDTCLNCGFTGEINSKCPICGNSNIQRLRRVTGYLTGNYTTAFNQGKQAEVRARVKHR